MQGGSSRGNSGHGGYSGQGEYSSGLPRAGPSEHAWMPSTWTASLASYRDQSSSIPQHRQQVQVAQSTSSNNASTSASLYNSQGYQQDASQSDWRYQADRSVSNQGYSSSTSNLNSLVSPNPPASTQVAFSRTYDATHTVRAVPAASSSGSYGNRQQQSLQADRYDESASQSSSPLPHDRGYGTAANSGTAHQATTSMSQPAAVNPTISPPTAHAQVHAASTHTHVRPNDLRQRPDEEPAAVSQQASSQTASTRLDLGSRLDVGDAPVSASPDRPRRDAAARDSRSTQEHSSHLPDSNGESPTDEGMSQRKASRKRHWSVRRPRVSLERHLQLGFEPMEDWESDEPHVIATVHPCSRCEEANKRCVMPALRQGFGPDALWRGSCLPCRRVRGGCPDSSHQGIYEWAVGPDNTLHRVMKPEKILKINSVARNRAERNRRDSVAPNGDAVDADMYEELHALSESAQAPLPEVRADSPPDPSLVRAALDAISSADNAQSSSAAHLAPAPVSQPARPPSATNRFSHLLTPAAPPDKPRAAPPQRAPAPPPRPNPPPPAPAPVAVPPLAMPADVMSALSANGIPLALPPPDPYSHLTREKLLLLVHQKDQVIRHFQNLLSQRGPAAYQPAPAPAAAQTAPAAAQVAPPPAATAAARSAAATVAAHVARVTTPASRPATVTPKKRGRPPKYPQAPPKNRAQAPAPAPAPEPAPAVATAPPPAAAQVQPDPEEEYEVEELVAMSTIAGTGERFFMVRWVGFSDENNTWEPEEELEDLEAYDLYMFAHPECRRNLPAKSEPPSPPPPAPRSKGRSGARSGRKRQAAESGRRKTMPARMSVLSPSDGEDPRPSKRTRHATSPSVTPPRSPTPSSHGRSPSPLPAKRRTRASTVTAPTNLTPSRVTRSKATPAPSSRRSTRR